MSKFEDNERFELEEINTKSSPPNFGNEIMIEKHGFLWYRCDMMRAVSRALDGAESIRLLQIEALPLEPRRSSSNTETTRNPEWADKRR